MLSLRFVAGCVHREQVELCVDILERILMALSPVQVAQSYRVELQTGLSHPNEAVKILALTQVCCLHKSCPFLKHIDSLFFLC